MSITTQLRGALQPIKNGVLLLQGTLAGIIEIKTTCGTKERSIARETPLTLAALLTSYNIEVSEKRGG